MIWWRYRVDGLVDVASRHVVDIAPSPRTAAWHAITDFRASGSTVTVDSG